MLMAVVQVISMFYLAYSIVLISSVRMRTEKTPSGPLTCCVKLVVKRWTATLVSIGSRTTVLILTTPWNGGGMQALVLTKKLSD